MLNTTFLRVREENLPELRGWFGRLPARRKELLAVYAAEGTRSEQFFLLRGEDGPVLMIVTELEDRRRGGEAFLRSDVPLAVEFKRLIQATSDGPPRCEVLYDSARMTRAEASAGAKPEPTPRPDGEWKAGG